MSKLDEILEIFAEGVSDGQWSDDGSIRDCKQDIKAIITELIGNENWKRHDTGGTRDMIAGINSGYIEAQREIRRKLEEL